MKLKVKRYCFLIFDKKYNRTKNAYSGKHWFYILF